MPRFMPRFLFCLLPSLVLCLSLFAASAQAGDLSSFNGAVAASYHHYRAALFYLRTGNPAVAGFETAEASRAWNEKVMPFAERVPDAFSEDEAFAADLGDISRRLAEADRLLAEGDDGAAAADSLRPVREQLSALRRRSGVIVFSDHVDAANAAMERLWVYRHEPPNWADSSEVADLTSAAAVTIFLYRQVFDNAPAPIAENPEFQRIMQGALRSLEGMWQEIQASNEDLIISYLRELRSFDRILWLEFG